METIKTTELGVAERERMDRLFDYSEAVLLWTGRANNVHYFAADRSRLCEESEFFDSRLRHTCQDDDARLFNLEWNDAAWVACMLSWFRGWDCALCAGDGNHIVDVCLRIAEKLYIPRFEQHLIQKMKILSEELEADALQQIFMRYLVAGGEPKTNMSKFFKQTMSLSPDDVEDLPFETLKEQPVQFPWDPPR